MSSEKQSNISQQFERPRFSNILQYFLNWRCDMEAQVEMMQPEASWAPSSATSALQDPLQPYGKQAEALGPNCGTALLAKLPLSDQQKLQGRGHAKMPMALRRDMAVIMIEILPDILVSDGHSFMEAIFTKESINDFRRQHGHLKFSQLRDKAIHVTKWRLQLDSVDSTKVFHSYQNLTVRLVIEHFRPMHHEHLNQRLLKSALSVFKNTELQTLIRNHRHWFHQCLLHKQAVNVLDVHDRHVRMVNEESKPGTSKQVSSAALNMDAFEMPSLKDVLAPIGLGPDGSRRNEVLAQLPNTVSKSGKNADGQHGCHSQTADIQQQSSPMNNASNSQNTTQHSATDQAHNQYGQNHPYPDQHVMSHSHSPNKDLNLSNGNRFAQNLDNLNFGGIIQKTQVFRFQARNFPDVRGGTLHVDLRCDLEGDLTEYVEQVQIKKALQSRELRISDMERLIVQEKGEQFYAEKKSFKERLWREQVEDEQRREQLKIKIEYFQIGNQQNQTTGAFGQSGGNNNYETLFQKETAQVSGQRKPGFRSSRRIIGYTLGHSAASIKKQLLRLLDSSKTGDDLESKLGNKHAHSSSPPKGRPRYNSQENILQLRSVDDTKTQINQHDDGSASQHTSRPVPKHFSRRREPLSQYVVNQNSVLNDDTQSEQDSFQENLEREMQAGQNNQAGLDGLGSPSLLLGPSSDNILLNVQISKSMFQSYLAWFESTHVATAQKFGQLVAGDSKTADVAAKPDQIVERQMNDEEETVQEDSPQKDVEMDVAEQVGSKAQEVRKEINEAPEADVSMQIAEIDVQNEPKMQLNILNVEYPSNNPFSMNTITEQEKTESNLEDPSLVTTQQAEQSAMEDKDMDLISDHKSELSQTQNEPEEKEAPQPVEIKRDEDFHLPPTVYRPPFQLPVVEEEVFSFVYDTEKPEPDKPLEEMNYAERDYYNTVLEMYEIDKQNAMAEAKKKWLARKRQRQQAYIERLKKEEMERQSMAQEEQRQREYEKAVREQVKREEEEALYQKQMLVQKEREAEAEKAVSQNQMNVDGKEEMLQQQLGEKDQHPLVDKQVQEPNAPADGALDIDNDELDWGEGESHPESQNQSQRSQQQGTTGAHIDSSSNKVDQEVQMQDEVHDLQQKDRHDEDGEQQNSPKSIQEPLGDEQQDEVAKSLNPPFSDSDAKRSELRRETYVKNMNAKYSHQLNQEIKRISLRDLKMRDVKNANNEDKLFDYLKISDMRKDNTKEVVNLQQQYDGIESLGSVGVGNGQSYFYNRSEEDGQREHHDSPRFDNMLTARFGSNSAEGERISQNEDREQRGEQEGSRGRQGSVDDQRDFAPGSEQQSPQKDTGRDADVQEEGMNEEEQDAHQVDVDSQQYCEEIPEEEVVNVDQQEDAPAADQDHEGVDDSQSEIEEEPQPPNDASNDQDKASENDEALDDHSDEHEQLEDQDMDNGGEEIEPEEAELQDEDAFHEEPNYDHEQDDVYDDREITDHRATNKPRQSIKQEHHQNDYYEHQEGEEEGSDEVQEVDPHELEEIAYVQKSERRNQYQNQSRSDRRNYNQKGNQIQPYKMYRQSPQKSGQALNQSDLDFDQQHNRKINNQRVNQKDGDTMIVAQYMNKRHPMGQNSFSQQQRSPVKKQRPPEYNNPTSPEHMQTLSDLQAQLNALQAQIGILTSQQTGQGASSPSRKMMISSSEQKRRSRPEHQVDKFSSPKSCSQFNLGQRQSPKLKQSPGQQAQSERYRQPDRDDPSQKDLNSTFGKQTYEGSMLQDEECQENEPRFGGSGSKMSQQQIHEIHEIEDEEQDGLDYSEPLGEVTDSQQLPENEQEVESEEEDLPVFGSQMKKKEKTAESSGSPRMSRSKSPENPTLNRIQTDQRSDAYSESEVQQSQDTLNNQAPAKGSFNQYKHAASRHRSRSVDGYGDADDEQPSHLGKRMRRSSDSSGSRHAQRGGRGYDTDSASASQSDSQLKFTNLSEFASIQIMQSNKQNVQEELRRRELKQQSKNAQARQDYLARAGGRAMNQGGNHQRQGDRGHQMQARKEKQLKDAHRYEKATQQHPSQRQSQPDPASRGMRGQDEKVASAPMSHRTANRQHGSNQKGDYGHNQQYAKSSQLQQSQGSNFTFASDLQKKQQARGEMKILPSNASQDQRTGGAVVPQKQVRGQMTAQQMKQLQRYKYSNGQFRGEEQPNRERVSSPQKSRHAYPQNSTSYSQQQSNVSNEHMVHSGSQQHRRSPGQHRQAIPSGSSRNSVPSNSQNYQTKGAFSQSQQERGPTKQYPQSGAQSQQARQPSSQAQHAQQRHPQSKRQMSPPGYSQGNLPSGNSFIKGAGSMVGANKRLVGPRQGGDEYNSQSQDGFGPTAVTAKHAGQSQMSQQPTMHKQHVSGHRVKKQLFQGEERQISQSNVSHIQQRQNSPNGSKKRPISPKQSDMMPQAQRSRGQVAAGHSTHPSQHSQGCYPHQRSASPSKNQAHAQSQRSYKTSAGMEGSHQPPMMAQSQNCSPNQQPVYSSGQKRRNALEH